MVSPTTIKLERLPAFLFLFSKKKMRGSYFASFSKRRLIEKLKSNYFFFDLWIKNILKENLEKFMLG